MPREQLKDDLARLHRELSGLGDVDAETRGLLDQLARDIQGLAQDPAPNPDPGLVERVEAQALAFGGEHPTLAGILRRMVGALTDLGI